jgi:hypothetical protein
MSILKFERFVKSKKFGWVLWILALSSMGALVLKLIYKIQSGQGLDYYISGKGYQFNAIGALTSIGAIMIALIVGWLFAKFYRGGRKKGKFTARNSSNKKRKT